MRAIFLLCCFLFGGSCARAQGPISGFPTPKGEIAIAPTYSVERYENYFLPDGQAEARDIETVSYSLFVEAGVGDQTSLVATLPWMRTNDGDGSLQDASLWLKYMNKDARAGRAAHRVFTSVGLSVPVGSYETVGAEAIGQRATVFLGRLTYQLQHDEGWFVSAQSGIDFQFSPESAAAWPLLLRTGYGNKYFYLEGWLEFVTALESGTGVTGAAAGTGSGWRRVGGTVYVPVTKWVGLTVGGARVLAGTYIGDSGRLNVGAVFKVGAK